MARKYLLKLKETASPHLYINDIKRMLYEDNYLHPLMKNTLLLMKKTRQPFVRLASKKEFVLVPERFSHFERALEPSITGWMKIEWCDEEKQAYTTNSKNFLNEIFKMYVELGYEFSEGENINEKEVEELFKLTHGKQK